jgi:phosphate acetyltransferase
VTFVESLRERARRNPRRLVFPEAHEPRVAEAVLWLTREGLAKPLLIGSPAALPAALREQPGVMIVDPATDTRIEKLASHLWNRRKARGMTEAEAFQRAAQPMLFGALLVAVGEADGCVAGAAHATRDVLRAALWAIGAGAGFNTVSAAFYMAVKLPESTASGVLTFADAAVVPDPNPLQLAEIAIAAAAARTVVVGDEPRVAFLSYSTKGSAEGPRIDRVREATAIFRRSAPGVLADGELQADTAIVESVARYKAPSSPVAGNANVLVFPNLESANIAYKLVERLAGARAIGPIVQGLARPFSDLSRGASVEDVVDVACVTGLMADCSHPLH